MTHVRVGGFSPLSRCGPACFFRSRSSPNIQGLAGAAGASAQRGPGQEEGPPRGWVREGGLQLQMPTAGSAGPPSDHAGCWARWHLRSRSQCYQPCSLWYLRASLACRAGPALLPWRDSHRALGSPLFPSPSRLTTRKGAEGVKPGFGGR